ncbi:MAG: hypothetical protein CVU57_27335 [Deltaproteobacteria bacterium HGW-Deltaproteobacteria-15]|jgi:hypothetical protein|nr:MAG: hypothetical protein CVU57_27335 [Deltaproteobacteria bacterium HGW-Deltaproteobacteria-15]
MHAKYSHLFLKTLFLISILMLLNPPDAQSNTAQLKAWCYSVAMEEATTSLGEYIYFTTYDGSSGEPPHDEDDWGNWYIGLEMKPSTLGSSTYRADYIDVDDEGIWEWGPLTLSLSTQDSNNNGLLDFLEKSLSANVSFSGTATPDWNRGNVYLTTTVTGSMNRSANTSRGSYSGKFQNKQGSQNFSGDWYLAGGSGTVTYDPGAQSAHIQLSHANFAGTNEFSGVATVTIQSKDQITFKTFTLSDPDEGETITAYTFTLQRSGRYYRGNIQLDDGYSGSSWRDYYNYRVEIYDTGDWNNDGVPDLTDPPPKAMPWLPLLLD